MVSANMNVYSISPDETTDSRRFTDAKMVLDKKPLLEDTLDIAPSGLRFCFDREHFLNDEFHSDEFILAHDRRGTSLEQMRDSLLQYSNILKSSLVELINQDYADFVNLSTNLVGLDKAIDIIASPLQEFHQSVSNVIDELNAVEKELSTKIRQRQQLRRKKDLLGSLYTIGECITRLERWLAPSSTDIRINKRGSVCFSSTNDTTCSDLIGAQFVEEDEEVEADIDIAEWPAEFLADCSLHEDSGLRIDRVANEYVKLQFFAKKCQHHPIVQHMKPRIQWITSTLQELLAQRLRLALDTAQLTTITGADQPNWPKQTAGEQLRQALSTYLVIDKLDELAQLYRQYALRPQLSEIFIARPELTCSGSDVSKAVHVLNKMYNSAVQVLDYQLNVLRQLGFQRSPDSYDPLTEFDCLVDGFWPETVQLLLEHLPDMFAAADPDRFYRLYTESRSFVNTLETRIQSNKQLQAFRNHPAYQQFFSKWSLPVYFQIRFQDIAGSLEQAIQGGLTSVGSSKQDCLLRVTEVLLTQLQRCWADGIFLQSVRHRFMKLTLQLLSRYAVFVESQLQTSKICKEATDLDSASPPNLDLLIYLLIDCHRASVYVRTELPNIILAALGSAISGNEPGTSHSGWLKDCLEESAQHLLTVVKPLDEIILVITERACMSTSRQIMDVPRQYRRTNRTLPTTPSGYVSVMVRPLSHLAEFGQKTSSENVKDALAMLICKCIEKVTKAYVGQLTELLNSVRKMEDSLRKLREARRGTPSTTQTTINTAGVYSDDDKIRHQLYLDSCAFRDEISLLWGVDEDTRVNLQRVVQLTETAKIDAAATG
ncbi:Conserved oligomeric Golgi complex subunit 2 [Paragonimus heterotremus]|uniref:Conserved oligomeric Golgi complex subunit 2 n=1 Tax=Paragonimus heterotremus TaxID=100268 RepID=A0A8J4WJ91_9TREM|nr:Conserved oligomeric Golgi complex subunit 2 [Paragonimus heterotremus]